MAGSATWHSSGEYGVLEGNAPVTTPLMEILDHLTLAFGCVNREYEVSFSKVERIALICGVAERRKAGVLAGPMVITRLPFAVHLTAASWACGGRPHQASY